MKVGDIVAVNEDRGCGEFRHITALGLGIILDIEETDDLTIGSVGPINLGANATVLLNTGQTKVFNERSLGVPYS